MNKPAEERLNAMEPILVELVLLAMSSENTPQRVTRKLNRLLNELEFAGLEENSGSN